MARGKPGLNPRARIGGMEQRYPHTNPRTNPRVERLIPPRWPGLYPRVRMLAKEALSVIRARAPTRAGPRSPRGRLHAQRPVHDHVNPDSRKRPRIDAGALGPPTHNPLRGFGASSVLHGSTGRLARWRLRPPAWRSSTVRPPRARARVCTCRAHVRRLDVDVDERADGRTFRRMPH